MHLPEEEFTTSEACASINNLKEMEVMKVFVVTSCTGTAWSGTL